MIQEAFDGLRVEARVVGAVILREVRTRFGDYYLGYLWAVFVPLLFVLSLTILFAVLGRRDAHGAPMEVLLFSGMMAWLTFSDTQAHASRAYSVNRPLLVYPMVTVVDIVIARTILEFATKICATIILAFLFSAAGVPVGIDDPLAVILVMAAMGYLGACFGHVIGCIMVLAPSFSFIIASTRRMLFFTSGVLFLLSDIPDAWREYILLNPLAHLTDMARGAWIVGYSAPYGDPYYVLEWAIGLTAAAAIAESAVRRRRSGMLQ